MIFVVSDRTLPTNKTNQGVLLICIHSDTCIYKYVIGAFLEMTFFRAKILCIMSYNTMVSSRLNSLKLIWKKMKQGRRSCNAFKYLKLSSNVILDPSNTSVFCLVFSFCSVWCCGIFKTKDNMFMQLSIRCADRNVFSVSHVEHVNAAVLCISNKHQTGTLTSNAFSWALP